MPYLESHLKRRTPTDGLYELEVRQFDLVSELVTIDCSQKLMTAAVVVMVVVVVTATTAAFATAAWGSGFTTTRCGRGSGWGFTTTGCGWGSGFTATAAALA
jgi:hypothetical protein